MVKVTKKSDCKKMLGILTFVLMYFTYSVFARRGGILFQVIKDNWNTNLWGTYLSGLLAVTVIVSYTAVIWSMYYYWKELKKFK
jgi:maltose-binding protein MalE